MTDALASWNEGPAKQVIVEFVTSATRAGSGVRCGGGPHRYV